ncbi:exodeoxyribonuclease-like [Patella vulgata]|uniref:exodeoxyribonuclease-like n=1 Tax=Patella vulgata TaxID=6465 RepID=UPI0024A9CAB9|nr:exodeoxyribonuclease-like [Patella vulgata]
MPKKASPNVNGFRDLLKIKNIYAYLNSFNYDIVCIQDTFWDDEFIRSFADLWDGPCFFNNFQDNKRRGVAILFKNTYKNSITQEFKDNQGRIIRVDFQCDNKDISVFSIYAPNNYKDRGEFYNVLSSFIDINRMNVICGDFNDVIDPKLVRGKNMYTNVSSTVIFKTFIQENNLCDIFRDKYPEKRQFTRIQTVNGSLRMSRIDYILISHPLKTHTINIWTTHTKLSDHSLVSLLFDLNEVDRGPGMWILNNTLLNNINYVETIKKIINDKLNCSLYKEYPLIWWDNLKYIIKKESVLFARKVNQKEKKEFWDLNNKLTILYEKQSKGILVDQNVIQDLESKLSEFETKKMSRSHVKIEIQKRLRI